MKKALITGITGQDGSYLTEILLEKGYEVHGIIRRSSSFNTGRIDHLYNNPEILDKKLFLHHGDLVDTSNLNRLLDAIGPDEIYNLAAQSHVKVSFEIPDYTAQVDALGTLRFLDAIREVGLGKQTKFYQASTSELFGKVQEVPQKETTPFYPRSPYGVAKLYGYWIVKNYREAYNIFACNGILFNHESPRRGETFVTRKITRAAARIFLGYQSKITLGNMDSKRDWGYAPEYCEGMWRMLQQEKAEDYVLATGETHTIREFCELTFRELGIEIEWRGSGESEKGIVKAVNSEWKTVNSEQGTVNGEKGIVNREQQIVNGEWKTVNSEQGTVNGEQQRVKGKNNLQSAKKNADKFTICNSLKPGDVIIEIDPKYYRPTEVDLLIGDATKAKNELGWDPKVKFEELVKIMVKADLEKVASRGY